MRKKKEKHVVKLADEKHENAYAYRINYTKLKETFLDQNDKHAIGQVGESGASSTESLVTEISGSNYQSVDYKRES